MAELIYDLMAEIPSEGRAQNDAGARCGDSYEHGSNWHGSRRPLGRRLSRSGLARRLAPCGSCGDGGR